ncbi:MAG: hypothetical protein J3R72DRAFT_487507 [Linnemannia gamsii]|nr:MAG: hypothetical protein J3R72DRAFT_487507 [Linnemannia gamsii]
MNWTPIATGVIAGVVFGALSAVAAPVAMTWATGTAASIAITTMGAKGIALTGMGAKGFAVKAIAACYAKTVVVTGPATVLAHSIGASVGIPTVATTIKVAGGAVVGGVATIAVQERLNEPRHDDSESNHDLESYRDRNRHRSRRSTVTVSWTAGTAAGVTCLPLTQKGLSVNAVTTAITQSNDYRYDFEGC